MELFVDKDVDLMRSTFVAVGIADLLHRISPRNTPNEVVIKDRGSCYQIISSIDVETMTAYVEADNATGLPSLLPAIRKPYSAKELKLIEAGTSEAEVKLKYVPRGFVGNEVDYGHEKQISDDARKARTKKGDTREEGDIPQAKPSFPVWAHLCSYFGKGSAMRVGYPSIIHTWYAHQGDMATDLWKLVCFGYEQYPNRIGEARDIWHKEFRKTISYSDYNLSTDLSSLAIVSPSTSKGVSDLTGYNLLNEYTPNTFWLEMYFAFAGYMKIAMPYNISSDVTTFYPLPQDINIEILYDITTKYRESSATSSQYRYSNQMNRAKLDVSQHIIYYQNMVEQYTRLIKDGTLPDDFPLDAISGIMGFYYKDISTQIPFDETLFTLPAWMDSNMSLEQLEHAKLVLEEHYKLVSAIRGKPPKYQLTADELHLLNLYRRYTTQGQSMDWIRFAIAYSQYRFRIMTEVRGFPALSLTILKESLPMNDKQDFSGILEDPSFQKVANAINYCTVYARYRKDVKNDAAFPFKVRHGLGDDLLRNAHDPARFIADLSKFIHDYHRESMNVQVDSGVTRSFIEPADIHTITELIAQYGSTIVAHLLVASGYASHFNSNQSNQ